MLRYVEATEQCCECGELLHTCCSLFMHAFTAEGKDEIICMQCAADLVENGKGEFAKIVSKFPPPDMKYDDMDDTEVFLYKEFVEKQQKLGNIEERE